MLHIPVIHRLRAVESALSDSLSESCSKGDRGQRPRPEGAERQALEEAKEPDLRRQALEWNAARSGIPRFPGAVGGFPEHGRQEAPEEVIILQAAERRIAPRSGFGRQQEWSSQEGPHEQATVGRSVRKDEKATAGKVGADGRSFGTEASEHRTGSRSGMAGPSGHAGPQRRSRGEADDLRIGSGEPGKGSSKGEQPPTGTRKPELVSQDLDEGVRKSPDGKNTGRPKSRRSGGWQRCRPPFRMGGVPGLSPCGNGRQPMRRPMQRTLGPAPGSCPCFSC